MPVLFCSLFSVVVVVVASLFVVGNAARGQAGRRARARSGGRRSTAGQSCYVPLGRHRAKTNRLTVEILLILRPCI